MSHYPHNPLCEVCRISHLKQKSFARKKEREDDGLPAVTKPMQQISTDTMVVAKSHQDESRLSSNDNSTIQMIRDTFSGICLNLPLRKRDQPVIRKGLKFFAGARAGNPKIIVKSDPLRKRWESH